MFRPNNFLPLFISSLSRVFIFTHYKTGEILHNRHGEDKGDWSIAPTMPI